MGWRGQCSPRRSGLWPGELVALSLEQPVDPQAALAQVLPCNPFQDSATAPTAPLIQELNRPPLSSLAGFSQPLLPGFFLGPRIQMLCAQANKHTQSGDEITVCSSPKEVSDLLMTICLSTLCKGMKQSGVGGQCQGRQK